MELKLFTVNPFFENTYLAVESGNAVLFDPGFFDQSEYNQFEEELKSTGAELKAIVLTHAHVDHIIGLKKVKESYDVPVYLHEDDLFFWNNFAEQAAMFGLQAEPFGFTPENLSEQQNWDATGISFDIFFTPGHAPGHLSFYRPQEQILIAGDTLFQGSIGRTDLYKGDMNTLEESIRKKLYTLPDETVIYPGHGPETKIGVEKKTNAFVRAE